MGSWDRKMDGPHLPCLVSVLGSAPYVPQTHQGQFPKHGRTFTGLAANKENKEQPSANSSAFWGILGIKDKVY